VKPNQALLQGAPRVGEKRFNLRVGAAGERQRWYGAVYKKAEEMNGCPVSFAFVIVLGLITLLGATPVSAEKALYFISYGIPPGFHKINTDGTNRVDIATPRAPYALARGTNGSLFLKAHINFSKHFFYSVENDSVSAAPFDSAYTGIGASRFDVLEASNTIYLEGVDIFNLTASILIKRPGEYVATPIITLPIEGRSDIQIDPVGQKIYWGNELGGVIRAELDGTQVETLASGWVEDLSVDAAGGNVYWLIHEPGPRIMRADLPAFSNIDTVTVVPTSAKYIAIDSADDEIYWTAGGDIYVIDLQGNPVRQFNCGVGVNFPTIWDDGAVPVKKRSWGYIKGNFGKED